jgi:hypothetical protein
MVDWRKDRLDSRCAMRRVGGISNHDPVAVPKDREHRVQFLQPRQRPGLVVGIYLQK